MDVKDSKDSIKVWLITGTSSGFGKRMVRDALARGDKVIATARNITNLKDLHAKYPDSQDRLRYLQLDVTSSFESIKKTIEDGVAIWGRIDVVVNNAGIGLPALAEEMGDELLRKQFEPNVFGVAKVTTAVLPHMHGQGSGTVVVIGSRMAWKTDTVGLGAYAASKAAVHAYAETLAYELKSLNIGVLIVEPGSFRTENMYRYPWTSPYHSPALDAFREQTLAFWRTVPGKQPGDPDKASIAIVDVVRGEGQAAGKKMPLWLVLGKDAETNIRDKVSRVLENLDEWVDVVRGTDLD
ncbi:NAD(P)-binding protein [Neolentinus lepideus HHB14362 ss-1]|uniref:NAD(P)-binding protein n=1 Tax=Neolentinus lepideus HHB14362 ss-1 TaxID=1314782 RepID=A0A165MJK7_9AGAM|nr:NAD(P)-binding protein [Neolentinus lepideus HHB14362 ss-1]